MLWMWSLALAADTMRLTVELTGDGPVVVQSVHLLQPPRPRPPGDVMVRDASGEVLASVELPPLAHLRTLITTDGHEVAQVPARFVTVDVPWTPSATEITMSGVSHSPIPGLLRPPPMRPAEPIWRSGPSEHRLDLVLLAEAYTAGQESQFQEDAEALVRGMLSISPFDRYADLINVWTVFIESDTTGIPPSSSPLRETALACFNECSEREIGRLICCDEARIQIAASESAPFADGLLVVVNSPQFGGSGGMDYSSVSVNRGADGRVAPLAHAVATHELAHHLFLLWDEYPVGPDDGEDYISPNCAPPDGVEPWQHWADEPGVGRFEPCHFDTWVSATRQCLMDNLSQDFCPVCREHIVRSLHGAAHGGLSNEVSPPPGEVVMRDAATFEVVPTLPDLELQWTLDGEPLSSDPSVTLSSCEEGTALVLTLHDPTPFVRSDPDNTLTEALTWNLRCPGDELPSGCDSSGRSGWLWLALLPVGLRRRRPS